MRFQFLPLILLLGFFSQSSAQTGCPGCVVALPELPTDTLYLSDAPTGQAGVYYAGDLSFRLPMTTTPVAAVDSTVIPGLPINQMTITSVAGLPPGLSWEASQLIFLNQMETDGCVRLCGTPLLPGLYEVQVLITAQVFVFTQTASFSFPVLIEPAATVAEGFTIINNAGCGSLTASFVNNVPSGGEPGFSYQWDFGNGNSSIAENPPVQTYTAPGEYGIFYEAIVDTAGFFLTQVRIDEVGCTDIFNTRPDLKIDVYDPTGVVIYTSDIVTDAITPLVFDLYLPIGEGNYSLEVIDDDGGLDGADDLCGVITLNQLANGQIQSGSLTATLTVIHPVDTITSRSSVTVYPIPEAPTLSGAGPFCTGDTAILSIGNYEDHLQWYRDSLPLPAAVQSELPITQSGAYWAVYTSPEGCSSTSSSLAVNFLAPPPPFNLQQNGNRLRLPANYTLPASYTLLWLLDGLPIAGETGPIICALSDGRYTLVLTNLSTGCSTEASADVIYDPGLSCTTGAGDLSAAIAAWQLWPNPGADRVQLSGALPQSDVISYEVLDLAGRRWQQGEWSQASGAFVQTFYWGEAPAGLYFVRLRTAQGEGTLKWIKR